MTVRTCIISPSARHLAERCPTAVHEPATADERLATGLVKRELPIGVSPEPAVLRRGRIESRKTMSDEYELLQQRIREKAHQLWKEAGSPEGDDERFWFRAKVEIDREEAKLDKEVAGSFPASDPPSSSVVTGATGEAPAAAGGDEMAVPDETGAVEPAPRKPAKRPVK
jgi:hypothetical protein